MEKHGIDVSVHNGTIDWKKVRNTKQVDFVILRAGFGRLAFQKDKRFEENYKGCVANKIPVGAYWYSYAKSAAEAKIEAQTCLNVIKGKKFDYPIWFDIEEKAQLNLGQKACSEMANAFCEVISKAGYKTGIYSMKSALSSKIDAATKEKWDIWVAHVGVNSTTYKGHTMWQYSWKGKINGIGGDVDCNICYKDYTAKETTTVTKNTAVTTEKTTTTSVDVSYAVYTDKWLPFVKNDSDYAGIEQKTISGLAVKVSTGKIKYRVHLLGGDWLDWVSTCDINDWNKGVAGIKGKQIDAIQVDYEGSDSKEAQYRVSATGNKNYYAWVTGTKDYAGVFGKPIDKVQIKIK